MNDDPHFSDIDPSLYSDSLWTRALKKRDAEIERLRAIEKQHADLIEKVCMVYLPLITELAEALVYWQDAKNYDARTMEARVQADLQLAQSAREAIR